MKQGYLWHYGSIVLSKNSSLISNLLREFHDSILGEHLGFARAYRRIKQYVWWPRIKKQMRSYILSCIICQKNKIECLKPTRLLQPLPILDLIQDEISMDFFESLPRSNNFNDIMIRVDMLSKYAHFFGIKHPFTITQIVQTFFKDVVKLHRIAYTILSDRGSTFTSTF